MKIEWLKPSNKLPQNEQECLLMPDYGDSFLTTPVFGPIMWSSKNNVWLDLFRDPEAGTLVKPEEVGLWTLWEPIKPTEDEE